MAKYPTVAAGRTVLRFLLGSETPTLASAPRLTLHTALKLESNTHGDVLVLDAIDGARLDNACSCTEKTVAWVRHALRTWPSVAFIAKSEDDTYVQLQALDYELRTHLLHQPRVLYGYHTLSMLPTRPTPRREAKPSDACVALAGRCRESRGCTEGSCKGMRKHTSSYSGVGVRDRDKVTEGCYLGDMEDKRDTREIFGRAANHWAFVNRDCGARQSTLAPFPTGPLAVFGSDLARLVFEDCAYVKSYYEAARKANRAGDGCRIAHRPPSLSEPDESLRVVLGDALLGHWLAACLGEESARPAAPLRTAAGHPPAERGAATVAHTTRTKSHHYQWRAAGMGWIAPSNLSVAIHGLKSKPADRSGPDNEVGGEWAHSHATVADATRTEFPPLLWKYSVGAVNAPGRGANPEINGSGARFELVNPDVHDFHAQECGGHLGQLKRAYRARARKMSEAARGVAQFGPGCAGGMRRGAKPRPGCVADTKFLGGNPDAWAFSGCHAARFRDYPTYTAGGRYRSQLDGGYNLAEGTAARGYRGGYRSPLFVLRRYAPSDGVVRPAVAAAAARLREVAAKRGAGNVSQVPLLDKSSFWGALRKLPGMLRGECDALHGDLRRLFWEDAGAPPESGLAEVVAEETLATAVTATLSVVAAAADIEGRAPPMRHRFARRDNYTLVWSWA